VSPDRIRPGSARSGSSEGSEPTPPADESVGEVELDDTVETDDEIVADEIVEAPVEIEDLATEEPDAPSIESPTEDGDEDSDDELEVLAHKSADPSHGKFRRLYYGETTFDFVRKKRTWFTVSAAIILVGIISLSVRGLDLSIEFVGGTSWTVSSQTLTIQQATNAIASSGLSGETVVSIGTGSSRSIEIQAKLPKGQSASAHQTQANAVQAALQKAAHKSSINDVSVESVGPSWGGQITQKAIVALIVFFILIALYISIFFEWRMAIAAIIAVMHDILVTVGIYSVIGFLVTPDTVVAFLTILGYSLYDTIVVFDRVRDNVHHLSIRDRLTFSDIVNLSMNQTLARSINTSLVAIMPILSILVIGAQLLGATTLQYFGLALLVGLTTGAYSSIFIASPLVAVMKEREPRYRQLRERIELRGPSAWLLSPADVARGFGGDAPARTRPGSSQSPLGGDRSRTTSTSRPASQPVTRRPPARRRRGGRR
jgi:preprotein translocase subunit SecF